MSRSQAKRIGVRRSLAKRLRRRETRWQFMRAYYVDPPLLNERVIQRMQAQALAKRVQHEIGKQQAKIAKAIKHKRCAVMLFTEGL